MEPIEKKIYDLLAENKLPIKEIAKIILKDFGFGNHEDIILKIQRDIFPHRSYRLLECGDFCENVNLKEIRIFLKTYPKRIHVQYHKQNSSDEKIYFIDGNLNNFLLTNLLSLDKDQYNYIDEWYNQTPYVTVDKEFTFDSCHRLYDYDGPCNRLHGHLYRLNVHIRRRINLKTDMVIDFGDLKKAVKRYIVDEFDHWDLNIKILEFQTTAENMVYWIWNKLEKEALIKGLTKIEIWETPTSRATLVAEDILNSVYINSYYRDIKKYD